MSKCTYIWFSFMKTTTPLINDKMTRFTLLSLEIFTWWKQGICFLTCFATKWNHRWPTGVLPFKGKSVLMLLTANTFSDSLSIQMIPWSTVALRDNTICSNLPSTGMAVLTSGVNLPHLWSRKLHIRSIKASLLQKYHKHWVLIS